MYNRGSERKEEKQNTRGNYFTTTTREKMVAKTDTFGKKKKNAK